MGCKGKKCVWCKELIGKELLCYVITNSLDNNFGVMLGNKRRYYIILYNDIYIYIGVV